MKISLLIAHFVSNYMSNQGRHVLLRRGTITAERLDCGLVNPILAIPTFVFPHTARSMSGKAPGSSAEVRAAPVSCFGTWATGHRSSPAHRGSRALTARGWWVFLSSRDRETGQGWTEKVPLIEIWSRGPQMRQYSITLYEMWLYVTCGPLIAGWDIWNTYQWKRMFFPYYVYIYSIM